MVPLTDQARELVHAVALLSGTIGGEAGERMALPGDDPPARHPAVESRLRARLLHEQSAAGHEPPAEGKFRAIRN